MSPLPKPGSSRPKHDHELWIDSLRDIQARCECGKWTMVSPTTDAESDAALRVRIKAQFYMHLGGAIKEAAQ